MNLTIEQLSKATKLSVSTILVYASQRNLGKKVGNKKIFSQADVKLLLKGSTTSDKKPSKTSKRPVRKTTEAAAVRIEQPKAVAGTPSPVASRYVKPSFWNRLFGSRSNQKKIGLIEATVSKR